MRSISYWALQRIDLAKPLGGAPNVLEIRKASFQVACNTDMKERNVATDGHSPNDMIMFSRLDDLPYSLTYGATLQALRWSYKVISWTLFSI